MLEIEGGSEIREGVECLRERNVRKFQTLREKDNREGVWENIEAMEFLQRTASPGEEAVGQKHERERERERSYGVSSTTGTSSEPDNVVAMER